MNVCALIETIRERLKKVLAEFLRQKELKYLQDEDMRRYGMRLRLATDAVEIATVTQVLEVNFLRELLGEVKSIERFLGWNKKTNKMVDRFVERAKELALSGEISCKEQEVLMKEMMEARTFKAMQRCLDVLEYKIAQKKINTIVRSMDIKGAIEVSTKADKAALDLAKPSSRLEAREVAASQVVSPEARVMYQKGLASTCKKQKIRWYGEAISIDHKYQKALASAGKNHQPAHARTN